MKIVLSFDVLAIQGICNKDGSAVEQLLAEVNKEFHEAGARLFFIHVASQCDLEISQT